LGVGSIKAVVQHLFLGPVIAVDRFLHPISPGGIMSDHKQGVSNRESAREEAQERREHPPVMPDAPPREQDAAGREGEVPLSDRRDRQTSHKAGSRSIAQKEAESKYADRSHPASHKVAGASGKEG
jgi:hypothetical protein